MVAFKNVLPDQGYYCAAYGAERPDRGTHFYETKDELIAAMRSCADGQAWYSYAVFKADTRRTADNVTALKSFVFDIDVGEGGYPTKEDAWWAFNTDLLQKTGLPEPTFIVDSGHGYHVYWVLASEIAPGRWLSITTRLKALLKQADPKLAKDTARVSDTAGLLRWPGTFNRKNGGEEKVAIVHKGELIDIDEFEALLPAATLPVVVASGTMKVNGIAVPQHILDRRKKRRASRFEGEPEDVDVLKLAVLSLVKHADNYHQWFAVLQALFNASHENKISEDDAFHIADEFSALSSAYKGTDDVETHWHKLTYRDGGARLGIGSLYHMASLAGWKPPVISAPISAQTAEEPHDGEVDEDGVATNVTTIDNATGEPVDVQPYIIYPITTDKGPVRDSAKNVRHLFKALSIKFWTNEFSGHTHVENFEDHDVVTEICVTRLLIKANEDCGLKVAKEFLINCIQHVAYEDRRHPVRAYLNRLVWDGVERLPTWLTDYLGVSSNEYTRYAGAAFLTAAVRRVMVPGCKFDTLLVLEGPQGNNKSTSIEALASDPWFSDNMELGMETKQMMELTRGRWILEVQELGNRNKRDVSIIKAQVSKREDSARMAFERLTSNVKRQFVMVGTTNEGEMTGGYLADPTGNRRFWPVRTTKIDVKKLRRDRDQLWAEAVAREAATSRDLVITLPERLYEFARVEQEKRRMTEPLEDALLDALDGVKSGFVPRETIYGIIGLAAGPDGSGLRSRAQRHKGLIERVMRGAGWVPDRKVTPTGRIRGFSIGGGTAMLTVQNNQLVIAKVRLNAPVQATP